MVQRVAGVPAEAVVEVGVPVDVGDDLLLDAALVSVQGPVDIKDENSFSRIVKGIGRTASKVGARTI